MGRGKSQENFVKISVNIPQVDRDRAMAICEEKDMAMSQIIRRALQLFFRAYDLEKEKARKEREERDLREFQEDYGRKIVDERMAQWMRDSVKNEVK